MGARSQKRLGPAWTERGRPPAGYFTKRMAEDWLRDLLDAARRGTLPGHGPDRGDVRRRGGGVSALRRARPRSEAVDASGLPIRDPAHLLPAFGSMAVEDVTTEAIERWVAGLQRLVRDIGTSCLIQLHGILRRARKVYGLVGNAAS